MARVLVPVADGSEEIEMVTIVDVLRRAGAEVTLASVMPDLMVKASRDVCLKADASIDECLDTDWDLIALPGGMPGAQHLGSCAPLLQLLAQQLKEDRWVGAICAAPAVVLGRNGLITDYAASCHKNFLGELYQQARLGSDERVCIDRKLVTSQAPGTAMLFALQLVECLFGEEKRKEVAAPMAV
ncbi:DJ-1 family glyoxalase III [Microbulbifer guangxiensis]|uniref:DJ-1 family glyoxalase III n=1 Tax=Microbulbifer guangxiensis TaxID=2904249 RepID=UPI001F159CDC|nr:DJ-1 family glyoxalase III [Microbulbifer guangxiensis]